MIYLHRIDTNEIADWAICYTDGCFDLMHYGKAARAIDHKQTIKIRSLDL
jgi:bifunctional ADP-heptose synthase (sugar kinase/adenylyltransferase)